MRLILSKPNSCRFVDDGTPLRRATLYDRCDTVRVLAPSPSPGQDSKTSCKPHARTTNQTLSFLLNHSPSLSSFTFSTIRTYHHHDDVSEIRVLIWGLLQTSFGRNTSSFNIFSSTTITNGFDQRRSSCRNPTLFGGQSSRLDTFH